MEPDRENVVNEAWPLKKDPYGHFLTALEAFKTQRELQHCLTTLKVFSTEKRTPLLSYDS